MTNIYTSNPEQVFHYFHSLASTAPLTMSLVLRGLVFVSELHMLVFTFSFILPTPPALEPTRANKSLQCLCSNEIFLRSETEPNSMIPRAITLWTRFSTASLSANFTFLFYSSFRHIPHKHARDYKNKVQWNWV